ncbi:MAG TPA: glycosyltransferase [Chthoniobacterales bacterium]|nr:glycosyltransferase [Chthoniobacterales bacterium]
MAAILHDAIPVSHPDMVDVKAAEQHAEYLRALSQSDLFFATSRHAAQGYGDLIENNSREKVPLRVCALPGEILDSPRQVTLTDTGQTTVSILCVSTLEPRKNHQLLIEAFEEVRRSKPDLDLYLDLVGDAYAASPQIAASVADAVKRNPRIRWHGKVEADALRQFYRRSSFTVYPSFLEGFGLPVLESLWFGKPCICANFGAMGENAAGGGCLPVDVRNGQALANGILTLAAQPELRRSLAEQAIHRRLKTWKDYAMEICSTLDAFRPGDLTAP